MKSEGTESQTVTRGHVASLTDVPGLSRSVTPAAGRNAGKRNFILQQGFEDPAPAVCPLQYSALVFQPKIVLIGVVAGILFQSQAVFAGLCALLWWSALSPKLNPFRVLYNRALGSEPGAFRLGPAAAPRRAAETQAGTFALATALLIHAGFSLAAYVFEAIFLVVALAVTIASFCFGSFVYHLLRGRARFALQTLPWADNPMKYGVKGSETVVGSQTTLQLGNAGTSTSVEPTAGRLARLLVFAYGLVAYTAFVATFLYAVGFIGNFGVPKAMDSGRESSLARALLIDSLLLGVFAIQHSVMARSWFKQWLTRAVPRAAERSTYVLLSSLALMLLFWQWRPIGGTVWEVEDPAGRAVLLGLYAADWIQVLATTFLINHFDLFGLRRAYLYLRGQELTPLKFVIPGPYKFVRHPLYVGWLLTFWATPTMTEAHLFFAVMTTAYILVGIQFEERDLVTVHGKDYAEYRRRVPMLIPRVFGKESVGRKTTGRSGRVTTIQTGGA